MTPEECVAKYGTHDWAGVSDWTTPTADGVPTADGEYRDLRCARCGEPGIEGRAAPKKVSKAYRAAMEARPKRNPG